MPFGNEADDFMKAFTGVMSLYSKFPTKAEKRLQAAQATAAEQAITPEAQELKRQQTEAGIEGTKAETDVNRQRAIRGGYENTPGFRQTEQESRQAETAWRTSETEKNKFLMSPEMKELTKLGLQTEQSWKQADTDRLNEVTAGLAHANTPEQRQIADDSIKSTIALNNANAAEAGARAAGADADAVAKARENAYNLTTSFLPVATRQYQQGQPSEVTEQVEKALNLPKGFFEKNYGKGADSDLFKKFAPGADAGTPGPQSAIPDSSAQAVASVEDNALAPGIMQASYTPDELTDQHDDAEGHDGGPEGAAPAEAVPATAAIPPSQEGASAGGGKIIQAQSGTRKQPISDRLYDTLSKAAADTGLTVRVTSGGQPSSGANRTGSHRHDNGNAADLQLIDENGHVLSMKDKTDRARMADFIMLSRKYGATGVGAAEDYMGDKTMHIGYGSEAVWGAGGHGKNAQDWVKEAYYGGGKGAADSPGGQAAASQASRRAPPKLVDNGQSMAYAGWKGVMQAGLRIGAVNTGQDQQGAKALLTGQGGMDPQILNAATDTYNKNIPEGYQQTLAERNLGMFAVLAESGLKPEQRERAAGQLVQSFRQKAGQYSAIAKTLAQNGRLDDAAKMMVKSYAYIPTGYDADVAKGPDGNYQLKVWDMKDPNNVLTEKLMSPDEMYGAIMQTSPMDFDRGMAQLSHTAKMPSPEYERTQGNIAQALAPQGPSQYAIPRGPSHRGGTVGPEVVGGTGVTSDPSQAVGQARGAIPVPNYAAMDQSLEEPTRARQEIAAGQSQIDDMNKATAQPSFKTDERGTVGTDLDEAFKAMTDPSSSYYPLVEEAVNRLGNNLISVAQDVQRLNPNMSPRDALVSVGAMVTPEATPSGGYDLPFRLAERSDSTMQDAIKVMVKTTDPKGGLLRQDINMSTNMFRSVQRAALQAVRDKVKGGEADLAKTRSDTANAQRLGSNMTQAQGENLVMKRGWVMDQMRQTTDPDQKAQWQQILDNMDKQIAARGKPAISAAPTSHAWH